MQITFLGGADEVGASSILIEIAGRRLLIDAGIRPTPKARWGLAGDQLPDLSLIEENGGLDAILVTHAHTDHTGALELVLERYPDVPGLRHAGHRRTDARAARRRAPYHADAAGGGGRTAPLRRGGDDAPAERLPPGRVQPAADPGAGPDRHLLPGRPHRRRRHDRAGQRRRTHTHLRRHLHRPAAHGRRRASACLLPRRADPGEHLRRSAARQSPGRGTPSGRDGGRGHRKRRQGAHSRLCPGPRPGGAAHPGRIPATRRIGVLSPSGPTAWCAPSARPTATFPTRCRCPCRSRARSSTANRSSPFSRRPSATP